MPKLIIVCGLAGSGKTTLASELSKKLKITYLNRDYIKELIYEGMEFSTYEESKKAGKSAINVFFHLAEQQIAKGVDVIMESVFNYPEDYCVFEEWQNKYNVEIFSVICSIDKDEREKRYYDRPRHQAHFDKDASVNHFSEGPEYDYKQIPGKQIRVTTNKNIDELVSSVCKDMEINGKFQ